jgi:hypothetical protein
MPVSKELQDVVELLGQYDESYQRRAIEAVLRIVNRAEEDVADSHLSKAERLLAREQRQAEQRRHREQELQGTIERLIGKAQAAELRMKFAELEKRKQQARRELGLD